MAPSAFYEDESVRLYCGDSREILPELDEEFDLILTDPPYGDTSLAWDVRVDWLGLIEPLLKPNGCVWFFTSLRALLQMDLSGWRLAQEIVWEKHNGSSFHADRFKRVHEFAVQLYRGPWAEVHKEPVMVNEATARTVRRKKRPPHTGHIEKSHYVSEDGGPKLMRSVIKVRSCHGRAEHPTEKPHGILSPIESYSLPKGGILLDPFAGVGTSLLAAKRAGGRAVGVEIDQRYCEIAVRRLSQTEITNQPEKVS